MFSNNANLVFSSEIFGGGQGGAVFVLGVWRAVTANKILALAEQAKICRYKA